MTEGLSIDWSFARTVANSVSRLADERAEPLGADVERLCGDVKSHVAEYTQLADPGDIPVVSIERSGWIDINLDGLRSAIEAPLARAPRPGGPLGSALAAASSYVLAVELGGILGYFSTRVLGQYHFTLGGRVESPPRLLFVRPNLALVQRKLEVEAHDFLMWIALHEVTHSFQFDGSPWLRPELGRLFDSITEEALRRPNAMPVGSLKDGLTDPKRLLSKLREGAIFEFVSSPKQRESIARAQAIMTVVEGHAEHVMHALGERLVPSYAKMRQMSIDRERRSVPERLLQRILGLDLKIRQYERGRRFVDGVIAGAGMNAFNRIFADPAALPTDDEFDAVDAWIARSPSQQGHAAE